MRPKFVSGVLLGLLLGAVPAACAGIKARDHILLPAARQAWVGISSDVQRGVADSPKREQILAEADLATRLLAEGDRAKLRTINWPLLRDAALRGIEVKLQAGEVGPGVAESLRLRIQKFDDAWRKL